MHSPFRFSAGQAVASASLPPGACDCHIHVYDDSVAPVADAALRPPQATVTDYHHIRARMGTQRVVLITPSTYGCNNAPMLAGLAQLGAQARGVAVISGEESDEALQQLHKQGVRGVRINLSLGQGPKASAIEPIAQRIAPLGWHLQLLMPLDQMLVLAPVLRRLPVDLVFDHFARIAPAQAGQHPAHTLVLDLLRGGRTWIKLSGGYLVSATHSVDDPALDALARSFIKSAPNRIVWGSDWPHATASAGHHPYPDDARQIERLAQWAVDAETLGRIMVSNPERLYGFDPIPTP